MSSMPASVDPALADRIHPRVTALLIACGLACLVWGLCASDVFSTLPRYRFRDLLWLVVAAALAMLPLIRLLGMRAPQALGVALLAAHVVMAGVGPVSSSLLLIAGAFVLGKTVMGNCRSAAVECILLGLALFAGVAGWLLPYAVHTRGVYFAVLALLIFWRWALLRDALRAGFFAARAPLSAGKSAMFCMIVAAMTLSAAWLPVMMSDDIGYHLALPSQLMAHGYYLFNVQDQVWAMAPWAGDVLHGVVMVLSGQETIGALNAVWLLLAMAAMWQLLDRLTVAPVWRWLGIALFVSTPLLHLLMNSMQTELASIAVLLALAGRVLDPPRSHGRAQVLSVAVLSAFLLALKFSNVAFVAPVLLWWLVRQQPRVLSWWLQGLVLGIVVAGSSYVYAAWLTGNPVLPLYNSVFQSPLMPIHDFANSAYQGLLSWDVLYQATFDTSRFFESPDGSFGFQWLGLFGALMAALWMPRLRLLASVAIAAILILFVQMQYVRYLMPALALIAVVITAAASGSRIGARALMTIVIGITLLNLHFLSQGGAHLGKGTITGFFKYGRDGFADRNLEVSAPERVLLRTLRAQTDLFPTVMSGMQLNPPFVAELAGRGLNLSWYAADFWTRSPALEADASGAAYVAYLRSLGVDHVLLRPEWTSPTFERALLDNADLLATHGMAQLYRMRLLHFELKDFLVETRAGATGFVYQVVVDPARPQIGELDLAVRCHKKGWAVIVTGTARGSYGDERIEPQTSYCGDGNVVAFRRQLQLPHATSQWEIQITTNAPDNPLHVQQARAGLRPDVPREHDLAARLRLF